MRRHWAALAAGALLPVSAAALTVCADPNNLPFSNRARQGFENHLAALLARDLGQPLTYHWWAQRRGFARESFAQAHCDLWPGVATGLKSLATTEPYYRSTYVFVSRASSALEGLTLDDPRLRQLRVGVQLIGDDAMNTPPAHALARRGITRNVRGFMLYGDYRRPDPPAAIIAAVADGTVDVALAWGPLAGYFAARAPVAQRIEPVRPQFDAGWPMVYAISLGVRKDEPQLRERLNGVLRAERGTIAALLQHYRVPGSAPASLAQAGGAHSAAAALRAAAGPR